MTSSTEEPTSAEMVAHKLAGLVGYDNNAVVGARRPRALFLYDGGCGVCKFLVQFVIQRDHTDAVRFSPLQSPVAQEVCRDLHITIDLSTAVLILDHGRVIHTHSSSVLQLFRYLGFPYATLGPVLLFIPPLVRDYGYALFARHRGNIWQFVKRITGLGDTIMTEYRPKIVGIEGTSMESMPSSWGFSPIIDDENKKDNKNNNENKKES
jgi:predicted DCC family thiol-disulfide oxidoreductase YuxK